MEIQPGNFGVLENWSLRKGGCLQEVVTTRVSTVCPLTVINASAAVTLLEQRPEKIFRL